MNRRAIVTAAAAAAVICLTRTSTKAQRKRLSTSKVFTGDPVIWTTRTNAFVLWAFKIQAWLNVLWPLTTRYKILKPPGKVDWPYWSTRLYNCLAQYCLNIQKYEIINYNLTFFKVLPQRIKHIRSVPGVPEIFYDPTGKEPCPRPLGEDHGMVVFDYMPTSPVNYFR